MRAAGEDDLLPLLDGVGLHDADAAEGLSQSSRNLGIDLSPFAEDRAQPGEAVRHRGAEEKEDEEGQAREPPVQIEEPPQRDGRGQQSPRQLHQPGPDEVPDPFGVGHHARDQNPGLRGVEVADRQARDVGHDPLAHLGDRPLRGDAEHLRKAETGGRLHDRGHQPDAGQQEQLVDPTIGNDVVHDVADHRGHHEPGQTADEDQDQPECEPIPIAPQQRARLRPGARRQPALLLRRVGLLRLRCRGRLLRYRFPAGRHHLPW